MAQLQWTVLGDPRDKTSCASSGRAELRVFREFPTSWDAFCTIGGDMWILPDIETETEAKAACQRMADAIHGGE